MISVLRRGCSEYFFPFNPFTVGKLKQPQRCTMYRNNSSPWLQKHNVASLYTWDWPKYRRNVNAYTMFTLIITVFVLPLWAFPLLFPLMVTFSFFPELFSASFPVAAISPSLHTPTQGHVVRNYIIPTHPHLQVAKTRLIQRKERMGKWLGWTKNKTSEGKEWVHQP